MKRAILHCAVFALSLAAVPIAAQTQAWTSVGSAGTIDRASLGLYATNISSLGFQAGPTGTVVARYNVTNAFGGGYTDTPPWNIFEMTAFDNSPSSVVSATLFEVDRCTGTVTVVCGMSSTDAAANTCARCTFAAGTINFATSNYVVEVKVNRTLNTVNPQLIALRIF
ncbi:MAG TPA: hypothetical protein VJ885_00680 [Thermoanaerobaculia bacterium]|nr:hypothetical protein [Thermoanaerobaculia bacterium]